MRSNKNMMAVSAVFLGCIGVSGAQLEASTGDQIMKQETGTATVQSTKGQVDLVSAVGGLAVRSLSGDFEKADVLRVGDLITGIDGNDVGTPEDLLGYVRRNPQVGSFDLSVTRNGRPSVKTVSSEFLTSFMTPEPPEPPPLPNR